MSHICDREVTCNICKNTGTIRDKDFSHKPEGEPYAYMDYVLCQNCGHKQLM